MKKSQEIYNRVVELLKQYPKCRDNDLSLCCHFWWTSIGKDEKVSAFDFMTQYANGKMETADSITRLRRKAQENFPDLRGSDYHARQTHKVKKAKQEIREIRHNINGL